MYLCIMGNHRVAFLTSPCAKTRARRLQALGTLWRWKKTVIPQCFTRSFAGGEGAPQNTTRISQADPCGLLLFDRSLGSPASPVPDPQRSHSWATDASHAPGLMQCGSTRFIQRLLLCFSSMPESKRLLGRWGKGLF